MQAHEFNATQKQQTHDQLNQGAVVSNLYLSSAAHSEAGLPPTVLDHSAAERPEILRLAARCDGLVASRLLKMVPQPLESGVGSPKNVINPGEKS